MRILILLFFVTLCLDTIYADSIPSISIYKFVNKNGVPQKIIDKIHFLFLFKIHGSYSGKYRTVDPALTANFNKELSIYGEDCKKDCMDWMDEAFQVTHRMRGDLEARGGKIKLSVEIQKNENQEIISKREIYLPTRDYEDLVLALITSLFEPKLGVLQTDVLDGEMLLSFSKINKKEIFTLDVTPDMAIYGFEKFIGERNNLVQKADRAFEERDYKKAYSLYTKLKDLTIPEEFSRKNKNYLNDFNKSLDLKISASVFNRIATSIEAIDLELPPKDLSAGIRIKNKYLATTEYPQGLPDSMKKELDEILEVRILSLSKKIWRESELKADAAFDEGNLNKSLESYIQLQSEIAKQPPSEYIKSLMKRIETKIKNIFEYKKNYFNNGAKSLCSTTLHQYKKINKNPESNKSSKVRKPETKYLVAKKQLFDFFTTTEYVREETIEYCKEAFKITNFDVTTIPTQKTGDTTIARELNDKTYYKFLLPGLYQYHKEPDILKSKLFLIGGILGSAATIGAGVSLFNSAQRYNNEPQSPIFYNFRDPNFLYLNLYNDIQTEEKLLNSYNNSKSALTVSALFYTVIYIYSIYDANRMEEKYSTYFHKKENGFHLRISAISIPDLSIKPIENIVKFGYEFHY